LWRRSGGPNRVAGGTRISMRRWPGQGRGLCHALKKGDKAHRGAYRGGDAWGAESVALRQTADQCSPLIQ